MLRVHTDDRVLLEMSETPRPDRLFRILEALEANDRPRFDFYAHEHPDESRWLHVEV
jgi:hypothetical protein